MLEGVPPPGLFGGVPDGFVPLVGGAGGPYGHSSVPLTISGYATSAQKHGKLTFARTKYP
jgi:hypothetical protein